MRIVHCVCVLALAVLGTTSARANLLTNGDFATGTDPGLGMRVFAGSPDIFGWTVLNWDVDYNGTAYERAPGSTADRSVDLAGWRPGGIEQTVSTIAGQVYVLSFYLAANPDGNPAIKYMDVLARYDNATFASQNYSIANTYSREHMGWTLESWQFTAVGSTTTIRFLDNALQPANNSVEVYNQFGPMIGNVSLTEYEDPDPPAPTPEPASLALIGAGLIGLAGLYRRRRSS